MSPDWSAKIDPVPYGQLADPQSLNLYAYVRNSPIDRFDADGHRSRWAQTLMHDELNFSLSDDPDAPPADLTPGMAHDLGMSSSIIIALAQQNKTQIYEAANERQTQENISKLPTAPDGVHLVLTKCEGGDCTYKVAGGNHTYYIFEHFTNKSFNASHQVGDHDFTSSKTGEFQGYGPDTIVGGSGRLDEERYFTISPDRNYNPGSQMSIMIQERGNLSSYEHLYGEAGGPSYVNYIPTADYHP